MATLTLTRCWVNLLATGAAVTAASVIGRTANAGADGDVHTYAGGRQRAITRAGTKTEYAVTLRLVPRADIVTLTSWIGQTVQVRDDLGRLIVGVYFSVPEIEHKGHTVWDVPLAVRGVTV